MFKLERWWRELYQRLEKFYEEDLARLKDRRHYDPTNDIHKEHIF